MVEYKLCNHNAALSIAEKLLDNHNLQYEK